MFFVVDLHSFFRLFFLLFTGKDFRNERSPFLEFYRFDFSFFDASIFLTVKEVIFRLSNSSVPLASVSPSSPSQLVKRELNEGNYDKLHSAFL